MTALPHQMDRLLSHQRSQEPKLQNGDFCQTLASQSAVGKPNWHYRCR
jgi:hypothetical protein